MNMVKILGREPALWLGLVAALIKLGAAFGLHISAEQQTWLNAFAAACIGLTVALIVHEGAPAAILGVAQAAMALAVGFGLHWSGDMQATVMGAVAIGVSMFTRTQVSPLVPAKIVE